VPQPNKQQQQQQQQRQLQLQKQKQQLHGATDSIDRRAVRDAEVGKDEEPMALGGGTTTWRPNQNWSNM